MTKPQLHFNINIPVTFSAPEKKEMTPVKKEKWGKEKIVLLSIVYVVVLICSRLFLLIFHSL